MSYGNLASEKEIRPSGSSLHDYNSPKIRQKNLKSNLKKLQIFLKLSMALKRSPRKTKTS
ncbi:Hypothetical protein FKW44_003839 [Caligus rogercresseyi]|uniref:Uncharacterized protein n=1 Tax=Caligus rogercresseyi TaxID=217165 RepID=A0A7T8KM64_CALRO|nr:Hypothetical protein FKW44_003839 [Caligus rogercresseyi]